AAEALFSNITSMYKSNGFLYDLPIIDKLYDPQVAISFEIIGEPGEISFLVGCPKDAVTFVEKQIHAAYPVAEISPVKEYNIFEKEGTVAYTELQVSGPAYYPIKTYEELKSDGLKAITNSLNKLKEHEAAVVQFVVTPVNKTWSDGGRDFVKSAETPPKEGESPKRVDPEKLEGIKKKISKAGLGVVVRVVCVSPDPATAKANLDNIVGSFQQFSHPHLAKFSKVSTNLIDTIKKRTFTDKFLYRYFPYFRNKSVLNIEELTTLMHFPNKDVLTPNIKWLTFKRAEPPANVPDDGLYLGYSEFRGDQKKIFMGENDRRRHMYILGQTGTGKSQFMMSLAAQDILEGRGVAFIDPHGDSVEELLRIVPKERAEDVIYFDPSDTERPMGLNILEAETEQQQHMAVNSFIGLLYKLYDPGHTGIIGPQLERTVRNVMLTAMAEPGNSMIEVMKLVIEPDYIKEKLHLIEDPLVKQYWTDEIANTSDFHKSEKLGYFVSKFDRFVTEKMMRNIIGQGESAFNFRKVMDEEKILLINLAKGKIGDENSQFLGLLFVPRILTAAMSRVDIPEEERKDFFLYVDEFQNFSTPDFAQILSEARKFRLCLTVANQFISQIDEKIRDAVFGNVGTMATMRAGSDDAQYLEQHFGPTFTASDIMNLTIGNAYVRLLIGGQPSSPFSMYSDYPSFKAIPRNEELAGMVRELSRLRYGRDREVVEAEIKVRGNFGD
ncbi:ATP-binding protein, partial [candidate division WWE3 bacterium]|nr:ATP-binding protein [candidate division WWE3 bacterium]